MLIALTVRADAAPFADPIAEAVRYANILTGADPDAQLATHAPDDPDDQLAGTSSDDDLDDDAADDDDDDDDDVRAGDARAGDARARDAGDARAKKAGDARAGEPDDARGPGAGDAPARGAGEARAGDLGADGSFALSEDTEEERGLDLAGTTLAEHAGELALLDDDPGRSTVITSDDAGLAASSAGAAETYEARMRTRRSWIMGRIDVGLAWRRRASEPMHAPAYLSNEVWLLATWRR